ncbi:hypothetical protein X766_15810 [Mesorhizobium sp. LSJC255A00]|uniref:hypothetical protein n=1 Tax=Mesorhizobium sp. LSJC255A00 TaxID=1287313 RepID=UPI0003CF73E1|nr:hypothetical protein [Mesorhizobium sp. LSJC255A00]ESX17866.1 hypothetical protein X766_15810 [Mesorhizobium sp. LSJC255A00]
MNLYHWALAECLKEYSCGDIIVMAETLDQAKEKAQAQMDPYLRESRSWWWTYDSDKVDEWSQDDYDNFKRQFESDLAKEPDVIGNGVIFIRGSE